MNIHHLHSYPEATITCTRKQWQEYCAHHDPLIFVHGALRKIRCRSLGGGVHELYTKKV